LDIGKLIANAAEELGLIVRPIERLNIMSPGLTITEEDVDFIIHNLGQAIERVASGLRNKGYVL